MEGGSFGDWGSIFYMFLVIIIVGSSKYFWVLEFSIINWFRVFLE